MWEFRLIYDIADAVFLFSKQRCFAKGKEDRGCSSSAKSNIRLREPKFGSWIGPYSPKYSSQIRLDRLGRQISYIHLVGVQSTNGIYMYYTFLIPSWWQFDYFITMKETKKHKRKIKRDIHIVQSGACAAKTHLLRFMSLGLRQYFFWYDSNNKDLGHLPYQSAPLIV